MASSSQTTIDKPDGHTIAPGAGHLYAQSGTLGCYVRNPGGQTLLWDDTDIQGACPTVIDQAGSRARSGGGDVAQLNALRIVPVLQFLTSGAATLTAPDLSIIGSGGGSPSLVRVSAFVDGAVWTGGIAVPRDPSGAPAVGTIWRGLNISGGGQRVVLLDANVGGWSRISVASLVWGFFEELEFTYDSFGWQLTGHTGSYGTQGGLANVGGAVQKTAATTQRKLFPMAKGNTLTNGIGFECDVTVSGPGGAQWTYRDVSAAWDGSNVNYQALSVRRSDGNAAAIALGFTGNELGLVDDPSFHYLAATPPSVDPYDWTVTNLRHTAPF